MRYLLIVYLCILSSSLFAQPAAIPDHEVLLADGHTASIKTILQHKPAIVILFSTDCDHCKQLTDSLLANTSQLKTTQILMVTPHSDSLMKQYYNTYHLQQYPHITVACDPSKKIMSIFDLYFFPGIYLYNKEGRLIKRNEGKINIRHLIKWENALHQQ